MASRGVRAFTLIELMVVIAVIALLIAILLPSLQAARHHAKTVVCASNMHHVGLAVANYLFSSSATYPSSYHYAEDEKGNWSTENQTNQDAIDYGYIHWSYFLYERGNVGENAFECPEMENGGAPRTNPGPLVADWEPNQVNANQQGLPATEAARTSEVTDRQARRMAFTANAAIMGRNKYTKVISGGQRVNVFTKENVIKRPGGTILASEFVNNYALLTKKASSGTQYLIKSHRPVNPFYNLGSGFNEYMASPRVSGFVYGIESSGNTANGLNDPQNVYGLLPTKELRGLDGALDYSSGRPQINALGRHHPNPNSVYADVYGGLTNFLFVDSHVEALTILDTLHKRMWGDAYYSLSGPNQVENMIVK
jgi:prepilin-type N-terminal cleavage/methylation domain-containing protein/prepilin-type processing-associated H-X9-DG protein